jgi:CrcB protein
VGLGGAAGAVLRRLVDGWVDAAPDGFPWGIFLVNVSGALTLAALPAVGAVRRRPLAAAMLGPGLLGGYTTMSAMAEQTRELLASGHVATGAAYLLGTLAAALVAVSVGARLASPDDSAAFEDEGGDR